MENEGYIFCDSTSLSSKVRKGRCVRRQPPACQWCLVRGKLAEQELFTSPSAGEKLGTKLQGDKQGRTLSSSVSCLCPHSLLSLLSSSELTFSFSHSEVHIYHSYFASVYISSNYISNLEMFLKSSSSKAAKSGAFFSVFSEDGISGK